MYYEAIKDILTEKIATSSVQDIEEFLGYQISADVLENLSGRIRAILNRMSEDELLGCEAKFLNNSKTIFKTGSEIKINDELSLVEWKCPTCKHRWWEYSDALEYPEVCPLCECWLADAVHELISGNFPMNQYKTII